MEAGKPVTYAAYRWTCNRLQDLLDSRAREAVRQQRIRMGALPEEKESAADNATLHDRVQRIRLRNSMRATQLRLWEIRTYVDSTKPVNSTGFSTTTKDLLALEEFSKCDLYGAFLLAVAYGQAMGYRAATMEAGAVMDYAYEILKLYQESPPHIRKMMRLSAALSVAAQNDAQAQAGEPPCSYQPPCQSNHTPT